MRAGSPAPSAETIAGEALASVCLARLCEPSSIIIGHLIYVLADPSCPISSPWTIVVTVVCLLTPLVTELGARLTLIWLGPIAGIAALMAEVADWSVLAVVVCI